MMRKTALIVVMSCTLMQGAGWAQDHHDDHGHYVRHDEWKKGAHIAPADWGRGNHLDWKHYHLSAPPRGYEWREVDGNYVLAAAATGLIASVVVAAATH